MLAREISERQNDHRTVLVNSCGQANFTPVSLFSRAGLFFVFDSQALLLLTEPLSGKVLPRRLNGRQLSADCLCAVRPA